MQRVCRAEGRGVAEGRNVWLGFRRHADSVQVDDAGLA